jgi:hypothetical protein
VTFDTIPSSPVGIRMLDTLVADGFATARPLTDLTEAALYEIVTRAAVEVSSQKWSACSGRYWPWEERVSAELVEKLAGAVATSAASRWWSSGVFDRSQVWLGQDGAVPTDGRSRVACGGKPRTEIWTSSAVVGYPSAWWPVMRDGADGPPPDGPCSIWKLTPRADAHVFEIRAPSDYGRLCDAFPGPVVDGWIMPDWDAAAERYDGIHLTVDGLIRAQGVVIETDQGLAMLDNWDAESTAWLRWPVAALERIGTIEAEPAGRDVRPGRASPRARRRSSARREPSTLPTRPPHLDAPTNP